MRRGGRVPRARRRSSRGLARGVRASPRRRHRGSHPSATERRPATPRVVGGGERASRAQKIRRHLCRSRRRPRAPRASQGAAHPQRLHAVSVWRVANHRRDGASVGAHVRGNRGGNHRRANVRRRRARGARGRTRRRQTTRRPLFFPLLSFPRDPRRVRRRGWAPPAAQLAATRRAGWNGGDGDGEADGESRMSRVAAIRQSASPQARRRGVRGNRRECRCAASVFEHAEPRWCPPPGHRAMDLGQAATDRNCAAAHDPKVASAMQRAPWLVMDAFVAQGGTRSCLAHARRARGPTFPRFRSRRVGDVANRDAASRRANRDGGGDAPRTERRRRRARDARPPGDIREGHACARLGGGHRRHAHHVYSGGARRQR